MLSTSIERNAVDMCHCGVVADAGEKCGLTLLDSAVHSDSTRVSFDTFIVAAHSDNPATLFQI
jgi:hypothetical protein